jgi:hypothetical protein
MTTRTHMERIKHMPRRPPYSIAGTVPGSHLLGTIRQALLDDPRERHYAIVELRNASSTTDHPLDDDDQRSITVVFDDIVPVVKGADVDQLRAMRATIRAANPGQGELDEAAFAAPSDGGNQPI